MAGKKLEKNTKGSENSQYLLVMGKQQAKPWDVLMLLYNCKDNGGVQTSAEARSDIWLSVRVHDMFPCPLLWCHSATPTPPLSCTTTALTALDESLQSWRINGILQCLYRKLLCLQLYKSRVLRSMALICPSWIPLHLTRFSQVKNSFSTSKFNGFISGLRRRSLLINSSKWCQ